MSSPHHQEDTMTTDFLLDAESSSPAPASDITDDSSLMCPQQQQQQQSSAPVDLVASCSERAHNHSTATSGSSLIDDVTNGQTQPKYKHGSL